MINLIRSFLQLLNRPTLIANTEPSEEDYRDYLVKSVDGRATRHFPSSFVITEVPPIKNQGSIGSCRAHSIIREYEIQLNTKKLRTGKFDGSELFHYYMTRKYVNKSFPKDQGMSMRDGCITALKFGLSPEELWPYKIINFNKEPDEWAKGIGSLFKIKLYERLTTVDEVKKSLLEGIPVGIGIFCDDAFFRYRTGYWNPKTKGRRGGHAVTVVGYTDKGFYVNNSWGTSWGRQGSFYMTYEAFEKYSFDWFRIILE
jgi:C1A family cysteine protease